MISASALTAMRAAQLATMTQVATIYRKTTASDGMGGETETWASVSTAACRVGAQLNLPQVTQFAARLSERLGWRTTFPALTDIRTADRLKVDTLAYEVLGVLAPSTLETARVCIVVERDAF